MTNPTPTPDEMIAWCDKNIKEIEGLAGVPADERAALPAIRDFIASHAKPKAESEEVARKLANFARHAFVNTRSDGLVNSLTVIELKVGREIKAALDRAANGGGG